MKRLILAAVILAASTGYGCVAHAQCPNGQCSYPVPQTTYATPVRQVIYNAAQTITQATAPKQCPASERRQPVRDAVRKVFGGRCR